MHADFNLVADRQLVVMKRVEAATGMAHSRPSSRPYLPQLEPQCLRARVSRDFTVPTATPSRIRNFVIAEPVDLTKDDRASAGRMEAGSSAACSLDASSFWANRRSGPVLPAPDRQLAVGRHMDVKRHLVGTMAPTPCGGDYGA